LQASKISRWHFELHRLPDGFRLRSLSENVTEVDGERITKGSEVMVKPGTKIRVSRVLTLTLLSPPPGLREQSDKTRYID
jgi:predicted component of type VI protein secretion system